MNERENEYRGCRLHRYLVAEATPAERQALREAIQRVNTEGATQIVLLSCYEVDTIAAWTRPSCAEPPRSGGRGESGS